MDLFLVRLDPSKRYLKVSGPPSATRGLSLSGAVIRVSFKSYARNDGKAGLWAAAKRKSGSVSFVSRVLAHDVRERI